MLPTTQNHGNTENLWEFEMLPENAGNVEFNLSWKFLANGTTGRASTRNVPSSPV